jgi:hypothetical protein
MTQLDTVTQSSMDSMVSAIVTYAAAPVALCAMLYLTFLGVRVANGDASFEQALIPAMLRLGGVVWLSGNLADFNYYVRDVLFIGLPNALSGVFTSRTGGTNTAASTAASFDGLWHQIWQLAGSAWTAIGWDPTGLLVAAGALIAAGIGMLCLGVMAIVYMGAREVLAVVIIIFPAVIACGMFDATKPILERAIGKIVALILVQVLGFVVLQFVLLGDQQFMVTATNASLMAMGSGGMQSSLHTVEAMFGMACWMALGTFALCCTVVVAYSIGSGVTIGSPLSAMRGLAGGGGGGGPPSLPPPAPSYSISLNSAASSASRVGASGGGSQAALPPPALSTSTRS